MKKLIYLIIGLLIIFNILKPEYVRINEQQSNACYADIQQNNSLICD